MDYSIVDIPDLIPALEQHCDEMGFTMPSDRRIGALLRTLCLSKPGGQFLELGTGIGLSLAWMVDGLTKGSNITSVDNDTELIEFVSNYFGNHPQVTLNCVDGCHWIIANKHRRFDLIFADTWPGKYEMIEETLSMLKTGGFYVIDDMNEQDNWPEGHAENVHRLTDLLSRSDDLQVTKMNWSTGIFVCVKIT
ncbi:O-methyltransferase [Portibacter marinus]|uniref:O-methyltransferase n=1 Tax=Portibacter marinus TaxID=2898660 RepID=UPI001F1E2834|nr:class I SAM-dependent methyltransferase [Portibacter marinus]